MTVSETEVHGTVAPGFEGLREAFEENFREHGDVGASVGVYVGGDLKVDLWGGVADAATGKPWQEDTVGIVYSVTKGATATLAWLLAQRGELDFDAPVTTYWPEFAGGGKAAMPVRYLFTHQAGLPYLDQPLTLEEVLEGSKIVTTLEQEEPVWVPGTAHGYHALTYGWLAGALIRKITGRRLGEVFAEEVAAPLDFHIGLPAADIGRVAQLIDWPPPDPAALDAITDPAARQLTESMVAAMMDPNSTFSRALSTNGVLPAPDATAWNDPRVYQAEIPAANGITNGRSLARIYAANVSDVDGVRLLSDETVEKARVEQASGPDRTLILPTRFGTGFMLPMPDTPLLSEHSFGHVGVGGALVWSTTADLARWDAAVLERRLLSAASWEAALATQVRSDAAASGPVSFEGYGYGWITGDLADSGARVCFHTGGNAGFSTLNLLIPERATCLVILCNDEAGDVARLAAEVLAANAA